MHNVSGDLDLLPTNDVFHSLHQWNRHMAMCPLYYHVTHFLCRQSCLATWKSWPFDDAMWHVLPVWLMITVQFPWRWEGNGFWHTEVHICGIWWVFFVVWYIGVDSARVQGPNPRKNHTIGVKKKNCAISQEFHILSSEKTSAVHWLPRSVRTRRSSLQHTPHHIGGAVTSESSFSTVVSRHFLSLTTIDNLAAHRDFTDELWLSKHMTVGLSSGTST